MDSIVGMQGDVKRDKMPTFLRGKARSDDRKEESQHLLLF